MYRREVDYMATLNEIPLNSIGEITSLDFTGNLRRRFLDLGFTVGAKVMPVFKSPAKDPIAYSIRGTVIALRNVDAKKISVNFK